MDKLERIYVFAVLINAAADYSKAIEDDLGDYFDSMTKDMFKGTPRKDRRELIKNEKIAFKRNMKEMAANLDKFASHFDGGDDEVFDDIMDITHSSIEKWLKNEQKRI